MKHLFLALMFICVMLEGYSQVEKFVIGEIHTLPSEILQEERRIAIYTPTEYHENKEKYPVLYLIDAEWNFHFMSALVDKLSSSGDLPKMIVVGIINNNRSKDLTPPGPNDNQSRFGGGEQFLSFLTNELKPWVKNNFRTHPHSILAGHSFGGLFTLYSMMKRPDSFQSYIALSPSLGRNDEQQVNHAKAFFSQKNSFPGSIYIAVGNEGGYTLVSSEKFNRIVEASRPESGRYKFEILEEESHISIPIAGFINGLRFTYEGYNAEKLPELDEIFLIESHYESLSERYGYPIPVPEFYFQKFTKEQIAEREFEYALFILEKYEASYPHSLYLLSYFANLYLLKGDFLQAKEYYSRLKELGMEDEYIDSILTQIKDD